MTSNTNCISPLARLMQRLLTNSLKEYMDLDKLGYKARISKISVGEVLDLIALIRKQEAELAAAQQHAQLDLTCVILWLENGCDPLNAAKELRLYQKQMGLPDVPVQPVQQHAQAALSDDQIIKEAVNRFLGWTLPYNFSPDSGVYFDQPEHKQFWPIGTNLFTADQARAMFEHCLASQQPAAAPAFPPRDLTKPAEQQGIFEKFTVHRNDGSDAPGGKHHGCAYFVLDLDHDQHAPAAMRAYANSCRATHPELSADIKRRFPAPPRDQAFCNDGSEPDWPAYAQAEANDAAPQQEINEALDRGDAEGRQDIEAMQEVVSDFRKATYEFAQGQDIADHARMLEKQREIFALYRAALAAPSPAQAECSMCSGDGLIGGLMPGDGGYHAEDCPDCKGDGVVAAQAQPVADGTPPHRKLMALLGMSANDDLHDIMAMAVIRIERLQAAQPPADAVPVEAKPKQADDSAIERFAAAMKFKMAVSRDKGRGGWDDETKCAMGTLAKMLIEHISKGDPVDIANFAMMLHQREAAAFEHHPCYGGDAKRVIIHAWQEAQGDAMSQQAVDGLLAALKDISEACNCCGDRADLAEIAHDALEAYATQPSTSQDDAKPCPHPICTCIGGTSKCARGAPRQQDNPDLVHGPSFTQGRASGIEEAAKVCESLLQYPDIEAGIDAGLHDAAAGIRALAAKPVEGV
jgi:hypothetical protein